ncbi:N-acetyltransferase [Paludibacter sp. 221]|uniref:GNAT family N-acetyltransferase n=1 Tax=Paludibacter sp. 221 TaxID=2302939 RepID=UPI0013D8A67C|nr:GNAT family N-acetyltransferase [Paludibacter sp. 221]NDV47239.1 N-acetyltransferase [Paludibacter sp. 221]
MDYIETPRLILRDWREDDFPAFAKMNSDENVMKYFPKTLMEEESREMFNQIQNHFEKYGYSAYAIESKKHKTVIGFAGFHNIDFDADFTPGVEILWRLQFDKWGKGYATEAASACLRYAKVRLDFKEVYSYTTIWNKMSENVMQKIGMNKISEFNHPLLPEGHLLSKHVLYKINL